MKVLVSDKLSEQGIELLRQETGWQVDVKTGLTPAQLLEVIGSYDALLVRSNTKVTAEVIQAGKSLRVIGYGLSAVALLVTIVAAVLVVDATRGTMELPTVQAAM